MSSASAGFNADDKGATNGANGAGSEPHLVNINEDQVSLGSSTSIRAPPTTTRSSHIYPTVTPPPPPHHAYHTPPHFNTL